MRASDTSLLLRTEADKLIELSRIRAPRAEAATCDQQTTRCTFPWSFDVRRPRKSTSLGPQIPFPNTIACRRRAGCRRGSTQAM